MQMAETAIADGITHVVATPHSSDSHYFDFREVCRLRNELQALVGDRLHLASGCDFHLNAENLKSLRENAPPYCINQRDYLLVEFNEISIPPAMDQTLHEIQLSGLRLVVTHPERNSILRKHPERLKTWVQQGCFVQITGGSLTGTFGPKAQNSALSFLGEGLVHFVASDAHNTHRRPLQLHPPYKIIAEQFGEELANALFLENPMAAFEGRELPYVPEIETRNPRRKRFFFF